MSEKVIVSKSKLTALGDAIRSKTGSTESLTLDNMVSNVENISGVTNTTTTLKALLDVTKSCYYLFKQCDRTNVDDLINYSDTENVTTMYGMFSSCHALQTIPQLDTSNVTTMYSMFHGCNALQTIPQLDTSNVTAMEGMFGGCYALQTIPQLDTSNVTTMDNMFSYCWALQTIPQLDTSNVTTMYSMFSNCRKLQTIPQLDTSNVTSMSNMFSNCYALQTIDLTSLGGCSSTNNMSNFAQNCYALTKMIIRTMTVIPPLNSNSFSGCYHFTGGIHSQYNPEGLKDGRIYVPDDMVESLKTATNWSTYADFIIPLSELVEE